MSIEKTNTAVLRAIALQRRADHDKTLIPYARAVATETNRLMEP